MLRGTSSSKAMTAHKAHIGTSGRISEKLGNVKSSSEDTKEWAE